MGKPRAKVAIDELIQHGFVARTERSTKLYPQYRLQPIPLDSDPIFLPVALVTGIEAEASMLRRVRETGDALLLRMLVDLYRSEEHTSELQSLMRISYAVFCLKK